MKILVTGSKGFIGRNFIHTLNAKFPEHEVYSYDKDSTLEDLNFYVKNSDIVYHFAGENRPKNKEDFYENNYSFTKLLTELLNQKNGVPIVVTSSTQAGNNTDYGSSKVMGEEYLLQNYNDIKNLIIYRLPNVYGKWSRPNYNSVVSTFAYNISRGIEINVHDDDKLLTLVYIDDLVSEFLTILENKEKEILYTENNNYRNPKIVNQITVGNLARTFLRFKELTEKNYIPNIEVDFEKKLYSTYVSFLETTNVITSIKSNIDVRGYFAELIKSPKVGQISMNLINPGYTKGNHWHNTKIEKFIVVKGQAILRMRKVDSFKIEEIQLDSESLQTINIPPGYTHSITNNGNDECLFIIWANEIFDPENPDTYYEEV